MAIPDDQPGFRAPRGLRSGGGPDEENYFKYSVTLRIHGECIPSVEITRTLGVQPTHLHRKGDRRRPNSPPYRDDAWHYEPPVPETDPLGVHLDALWAVVEPSVEYLKSLKQWFRVDIFCGYRTNCGTAGFEVSYESLKIFGALEVPFDVSVIIM